MSQDATVDQLASRKEVSDFLDRMKSSVLNPSKWFSRPPEELQANIEKGRWYNEVKDSMWMQFLERTIQNEIAWAQEKLESCEPEELADLRCYLKALRFVKGFILTTERNADISTSVLAGRPKVIARDAVQFVKSVVPQERNVIVGS